MNVFKIKLLLSFLPLLLLGSNLFAQSTLDERNLFSVTDAQVEKYINEVFADKAQELIYGDLKQLERTKAKFRQIKIVEDAKLAETNLPDLAEVPLASTYNQKLKRDYPFDPANFNPLKYKLDFFRQNAYVYYKVDGTPYIIVITPYQL